MLLSLQRRRLYSQMCKHRSKAHLSSSPAIQQNIGPEGKFQDYSAVLRQIDSYGSKLEYRKLFVLIDSLPLDSVVDASIRQMKKDYPPPLAGQKYSPKLHTCPASFSYMMTAFVLMRSEKVREMIEFSKTDMILADHVGSESLFDACCLLYELDQEKISKNRKSHTENNLTAGDRQEHTSNKVPKSSVLPNIPNYHTAGTAHPIQADFMEHYTEWLLRMTSAQRYHHTVNIMCKSHVHLDRSLFFTSQLQYLHDKLKRLQSEGKDADFFAIGDVGLSGFTSARMFTKIDIALRRMKNKLVVGDVISSEAFSLAITGCITSKKFENDPVKDQRKVSREALNALLTMAAGNTFQCIYLRGIFLNMLLSKGFGHMVIEYATKFRKEGLLISTRGCNSLLQAHILVRDYDSAFDTLQLVDYEEEIVRSHGMKIFSDAPVPFELLEEPINRYTVRGINHNRHIKRNIHSFVVNNTTKVTKEMQEEAQVLRDAERLTRMNEPPLPDPLFAGRNLTLEAERNPRTVPEFGLNLHTCISLIFNPYINLASRANYINKKDSPGAENVFFKRVKVADVLIRILQLMDGHNIRPDARFLSKAMIIAKSTGSSQVIFNMLNLAAKHYNSKNRWWEPHNVQPHTMSDNHVFIERPNMDRADFQNCVIFEKNRNMEDLTAEDMGNYYELAIESKMIDEDIQTAELLLLQMTTLQIPPTPTVTKLLLGFYLKKKRYEDLIRLFEAVPSWGGDRNFVHGSILILALTQMGRLADAWRGTEMLRASEKYLSYDAAKALFTGLIITLIDPKAEPPSARKKLSKKVKINAVAYLIMSLLRYYPQPVDRIIAVETRTCVTDYILELASREPEIAEAILININEKCRAEEIKICYDWIEEMKQKNVF